LNDGIAQVGRKTPERFGELFDLLDPVPGCTMV
jgi:hypothetical protein